METDRTDDAVDPPTREKNSSSLPPEVAQVIAEAEKWIMHLDDEEMFDFVEFDQVAASIRSLLALLRSRPSTPEPGWRDIETAPKDGTRIDLWAKAWLPAFDRFEFRRFPDCVWMSGDSMCNRPPYWMNLSKEWHPTHWMPVPDPPVVTPEPGQAQTGETR